MATTEAQALARFTIFAAEDARAEVEPVLRGLRGVEVVDAHSMAPPPAGPAVLLLSAGLIEEDPTAIDGLPEHVVVVAADETGREAGEESGRLFLSLADFIGEDGVLRALRSAARYSAALIAGASARSQLDQLSGELRELNKIGMALMSERDPEQLLNLILTQARRLTTSDAGSLYLVEQKDGQEMLHFLRAQNDTLPNLPSPDFTLPLDRKSIAGCVALTGEPLTIDDVYNIPSSESYSFNRAFDEKNGYRAKSMLVVPMKDHKDRVVGVLQLINRKRDPRASVRNDRDADAQVLPYGEREVGIVHSLAGQAAVSIENGRLYRDIENLFEGFIKAAVIAIDQRDPTTSGHSVRVATLTCDIAEVMDRVGSGPFADVRFTREQMKELRYAGLLHDFGKVGVREEVLVKSKKLPPVMQERIESRFDLIRRTLEAEFHRRRADYIAENGRDGLDAFLSRLEDEFKAETDRVLKFQQAIRESNEPRILPEASAGILKDIAQARFTNFDNTQVPYLREDELHYLSIPKGSLDPDERKQIESHVTHTFNFLTQIPWTEDLSRVAEIAYGHHEKLDGTGYPRGVNAQVIPVQTRIMTVSDIFDALTASDRPYKKALPATRALEILDMEGKAGQLDAAIVTLLLESEVYKKVLEEDWRRL